VVCACEVTQSFSVLFCIVRPVHKFDFRLVKKETSSKLLPVFIKKPMSYCHRESYFDRISKISPTNMASVKTLKMLCKSTAFC
jgi:hypothetical protein